MEISCGGRLDIGKGASRLPESPRSASMARLLGWREFNSSFVIPQRYEEEGLEPVGFFARRLMKLCRERKWM